MSHNNWEKLLEKKNIDMSRFISYNINIAEQLSKSCDWDV